MVNGKRQQAGVQEALVQYLQAAAAGDENAVKKCWDPSSPFGEFMPQVLRTKEVGKPTVRSVTFVGDGEWGNIEVELPGRNRRLAEYSFRQTGERWLLYSYREFRDRLRGQGVVAQQSTSFGRFPQETRPSVIEKPPMWLSDARRARDPASPGEYARAVLKWQRFVLAEPMLESAVITANMMSRCIAEPLRELVAATPGKTFENVAAFVQQNIDQQVRVFDDPSQPFGQVQLHPVTPCHTADEASAIAARFGRAAIPCVAIQYFNVAALLLSGQFCARDMIGVRLSAGDVRHEGLCVNVDGSHYFCTNTEFLHMDGDYYRVNQVTGLFGDRLYRGERGSYTIDEAALGEIEERLLRRVSRQFRLSPVLKEVRPKDSRPLPEEMTMPPVSDTDLMYDGIRAQVFRLSADAPDSHWTYAKYASQELNVSRPEAYATASAMGPLCKRRAKELKKPQAALDWMHENIKSAPVFPEIDRVQYGDQVLVYERGTPRDKALLGYGMMTGLGIQSWVVVGARAAYLAYSEDGKIRLHDVAENREIQELPESPLMAFSDRECWFPAANRYELAPEVAGRLGLSTKA